MKIFRFVKKIFFIGLTILSNLTNVTPLNCISMKNQECKTRPQVINVNSNNPIFYLFSIITSKCKGDCNNINNPYAKVCVPDYYNKTYVIYIIYIIYEIQNFSYL